MAIITVPTVNARNLEMGLLRADTPIELFGGSEVILGSTKALWFVTFPLTQQDMNDIATTRSWRSALAQLAKISVNTFQIVPPDWAGNGASYSGSNPLVKGTGQLGLDLDCDGVTASTAIALEGDYIQVGTEFKVLTADANSDGMGNVTFNFEPALRAAPTDNSTVDVKDPKLTLRLLDPRVAWQVSKPLVYDITINAIESFPAT